MSTSKPISERRYSLDGQRYRDSGDIDSDHYWGPSLPEKYKTISQWAAEGVTVTPGRRAVKV